jgi:hypothetical protein
MAADQNNDPNKLAIFVTSPQHMTHVVGIAEAAVRAEKRPMIFFYLQVNSSDQGSALQGPGGAVR